MGLSSISLPDARINVHAIVPKSIYLVSAKWAVQKGWSLVSDGANVKMDDIDDLDSVMRQNIVHACLYRHPQRQKNGSCQKGRQM